MTTKTLKIDNEVLGVLRRVTVEDTRLFIAEQLDQALYKRVNRVLELMGGKWKRGSRSKPGAHEFEWDPRDQLADVIASREIVDWKKTLQFYATPAHIARNLVEWADLEGPDLRILEPSAGQGAIAREIAAVMHATSQLYLLELDERNRNQHLFQAFRGDARVGFIPEDQAPGYDFLQHRSAWLYDRIVANPPFCRLQDVKHVLHMWELLAPGGILVSVMSAGAEFRSDAPYAELRELVQEHRGWLSRLPDKAFSDSGTDVSTVVVKLQKPGVPAPRLVSYQAEPTLPPLFQQYWAIKREYPDVMLCMRIGDFYELFGSDAETGASVLEITLTSRDYVKGERIPMCGFPHHSADRYTARLIAAGYRVALCEQVEDPLAARQKGDGKLTRVVEPPAVAPVVLKADTPTRNGTLYPAELLAAAAEQWSEPQGSFDF